MHSHETRWTRKLEDYNKDDYSEEEVSDDDFKRSSHDEDNEAEQELISNVVKNVDAKLASLKNRTLSAQQEKLEELERAEGKNKGS